MSGNVCLGNIRDGEMRLSDAGRMVPPIWLQLSNHHPHIRLDAFVIMPNHVHGIVILNDCADVGAGLKPAPTDKMRHGLPEIIRAFKTFSSRRINEFRKMIGVPVWQRNYYEHVVRNAKTLKAIGTTLPQTHAMARRPRQSRLWTIGRL